MSKVGHGAAGLPSVAAAKRPAPFLPPLKSMGAPRGLLSRTAANAANAAHRGQSWVAIPDSTIMIEGVGS